MTVQDIGDRQLESYWACRNWYDGGEPTIGQCFEAGYQSAKSSYSERLKELEAQQLELREWIKKLRDIGDWL